MSDENRIAGMTLTDGRAALVVLAKDGDEWRVARSWTGPLDDAATFGGSGPGCPVVLDATAWRFRVGPTREETHMAPSDALRLAGWDIRPPLWRGSRAANPSDAAMADSAGPLHVEGMRAAVADAALARAFMLAAWGATRSTRADPPACTCPPAFGSPRPVPVRDHACPTHGDVSTLPGARLVYAPAPARCPLCAGALCADGQPQTRACATNHGTRMPPAPTDAERQRDEAQRELAAARAEIARLTLPPILNGYMLDTVIRYRLDVTIIDGKRRATGQIVFAVMRDRQELDFTALLTEPFNLRLQAGSVCYSLDECEAGEPYDCADVLIDGEWLAVDAATDDVTRAFKFHSDDVRLMES